jgi:hypothetical protein
VEGFNDGANRGRDAFLVRQQVLNFTGGRVFVAQRSTLTRIMMAMDRKRNAMAANTGARCAAQDFNDGMMYSFLIGRFVTFSV